MSFGSVRGRWVLQRSVNGCTGRVKRGEVTRGEEERGYRVGRGRR